MNLKECRLLVTPTSYGKNDARLKTDLEAQVGEVIYNPTGKPLTSAQVAELLPGIDGYIAGLDGIDANALKAGDRLKVIARYGVGVDSVDLVAARQRGIIVTNTPGANSVSVAELALGLMLALARQIPEAVEAVHQGKWPRYAGLSLEGKTVGILGLGAIGKQLARRLAGFDCRLLAHDPFGDPVVAKELHVQLTGLEEVLAQADFLSLHLPLLPETRSLVNGAFLGKMKKGSFLINTSRGSVVEEAALVDALESKRIAGSGLDVFEFEPKVHSALRAMPHVVMTPHIGTATGETRMAMAMLTADNLLAALAGERPPNLVNPEVWGKG